MNIINTLKPSQISLTKRSSYKKGTILYRENDICKNICVVLKGKLNIVTYLEDGSEVMYNEIKENEVFGNNLIFSSEPYYKGNIITLEDSEIISIDRNNLLTILLNNHEFMIEYLRESSDFTKVLNNKIKLLSMQSAEDRLYFCLHENGNKIEFSSISDLAKQLYLQRETLSRLISKLVKQKKIKKQANHIQLL